MSPLKYKVYGRVVGRKEALLASFRYESSARAFMEDTYTNVPYRFSIKGTRVVIKLLGKIIAKKEYK